MLKKHFQLISYQTFPFPIIRDLPFYLLSEQSARVTGIGVMALVGNRTDL